MNNLSQHLVALMQDDSVPMSDAWGKLFDDLKQADCDLGELLALREAGKEPVAWIVKSPQGDTAHRVISKEDAEYIERKGYMTIPLYAAPQLPAVPRWISVENELPDASSDKRVCAYTPSEYGDLQYRSVPASLFKSVCSQATHWHYFTVPGTAIAAAPKTE